MKSTIAKIDPEELLRGDFVPVSRCGKYPQVDLTRDVSLKALGAYSEAFEVAVGNFDHKPDGPAQWKIRDWQLRGDEWFASCYGFLPEAEADIRAGKYFRPSIELYPSHPQLPDRGPYPRGFALLGNKSAQVRGTPKKFATADGVEYVGFETERGGYVLLESAELEVSPMTTPITPPANPPAEGDNAKLKDKVKNLQAETDAHFATLQQEREKDKAKIAALEAQLGTVTTTNQHLVTFVEKQKAKAFSAEISATIDSLSRESRITPGVAKPLLAILETFLDEALPATGVVKLGEGEKVKTFDNRARAILAVLSDLPQIFPGGIRDGAPQPGGVGFQMENPPLRVTEVANLSDAYALAAQLTDEQIAAGKFKIGTPEAGAFYESALREQTAKFNQRRA